ncbi:hypothetical protein DsansV1_C06g0058681 [Dioscorea sansibarensis]
MPYPSRALEPLGSELLTGLDKCGNLFNDIRPRPSWLRLKPLSSWALSQRRLAAAALDQSFSNPESLLAIRPILKKHSEKASAIAPEKLDEWMNESICEIVKRIGEAPYLLHIFSAGAGDGDRAGSSSPSPSSSSLRLEREPALWDKWPHITRRWDEGKPIPDGIVLVEEIEAGDMEVREDGANGIRTWGLLIQGRGMECASCYLLKTCRVRGPAGFCTHFSLVKAKCFGDPAEVQIRKAWLAG